MVCVWYLLSSLTPVDGTSVLTDTSVFPKTSKSHQNNICLHHLTFLWLTLFIRIKVKCEQETADLGKGCRLPPQCCCTLWIYNSWRVSVVPWKMTRKTRKKKTLARSVECLYNTRFEWPNSYLWVSAAMALDWYFQTHVDAQIHLSFTISIAEFWHFSREF